MSNNSVIVKVKESNLVCVADDEEVLLVDLVVRVHYDVQHDLQQTGKLPDISLAQTGCPLNCLFWELHKNLKKVL